MPNASVEMEVYVSNVSHVLKTFEYCKENNAKGFALAVPAPVERHDRIGRRTRRHTPQHTCHAHDYRHTHVREACGERWPSTGSAKRRAGARSQC